MENQPLINTTEQFSYVTVSKHDTKDYPLYEQLGRPLPMNPYFMHKAQSWALGDKWSHVVYHLTGKTQDLMSEVGRPMSDTTGMFKRVNDDLENQTRDLLKMAENSVLEKIGRISVPIYAMYRERRDSEKLLRRFVENALYAVRNLRHPKRILWKYGVYDPQKHTRSFLKHLKKNTMSAETAGDAWLQYRFAWKPLIHDIQTSVVAAMEYEKKIRSFRVSKRVKVGLTSSVNYYSSFLLGSDVWKGEREGYIRVGVTFSFSDPSLAALSSFTNIPATVWDFVPWSFVIDRVVDISTYLDLYDATSGATFNSGYRTMFYNQRVWAPQHSQSYYPDIVRRFTQTGGRTYYNTRFHVPPREDVHMAREVLYKFPQPHLLYPLSFKAEHGVDYVALVRQLVARFRSKPVYVARS